ncbi:MAG: formate dehydrogenase accessory sulfurtransferase FdhD [Gammaproteobacteria bacterium]|nr:formate dehydrogenase accessory sulfurtransferase FdhD [Gammaproteobacteria bacterium]
MGLPPPAVDLPRLAVSSAVGRAGSAGGTRALPEEVAIALTYNRASYAVMMATPLDIEDFGVGFSLNEGVIASPAELADIEAVGVELGIELRMTLTGEAAERTAERRRRIAGPVGCGLCGVESLEEALRPLPQVDAPLTVAREDIGAAVAALGAAQALNRRTRAVHAAGFWHPARGLVAVREDVGRHNALDKLTGALARAGERAAEGMVVISSRVSIEMVQKAAMMGAGILVAVSAPTALAVRSAQAAGLTLVAVAREDGFEVFSEPRRIRT